MYTLFKCDTYNYYAVYLLLNSVLKLFPYPGLFKLIIFNIFRFFALSYSTVQRT